MLLPDNSAAKRFILYCGERGELNYRVVTAKALCDRRAVATIHSVALCSQLMIFRYWGLSEPCCLPQLFLQTDQASPAWETKPGCSYRLLCRHPKCGVGSSAALHLLLCKCILGGPVPPGLSKTGFPLLALVPRAESFPSLSLTPQSGVTEGQPLAQYRLAAVSKFTAGCQDLKPSPCFNQQWNS